MALGPTTKRHKPNHPNLLMTVDEVAAETGRHPVLIRRWVRKGTITAIENHDTYPPRYMIPFREAARILTFRTRPDRRTRPEAIEAFARIDGTA